MISELTISALVVVCPDTDTSKVRAVLSPVLDCHGAKADALSSLVEHENTLRCKISVTGTDADQYIEALLDTMSSLIALGLCEPLNVRIDHMGIFSLPEYISVGIPLTLGGDC